MVTDATEPFSKSQNFGNFVPETRVTAVTKFALSAHFVGFFSRKVYRQMEFDAKNEEY